MKSQAQHVDECGEYCPHCGSSSIEGQEVTTGGGMAYQDMLCLKCEGVWEDRYSLTSWSSEVTT